MEETTESGGQPVDAMLVIEQLRNELSEKAYELAIARARLKMYEQQTRESHDHDRTRISGGQTAG